MIDPVGERFGRYVVLREVERAGRARRFLCRCDCGTEKVVRLNHLRRGTIRSCGCLAKDRIRETKTTHGMFVGARDINGRRTRLYTIWMNMRRRCSSPVSDPGRRYVGRGIQVCHEWQDFATFRDWSLAHGYRDDLTIDRIDNDGNYEPSNCRWIPLADQARNRSSTRLVTHAGRTQTLTEWSEELGMTRATLRRRLERTGTLTPTKEDAR